MCIRDRVEEAVQPKAEETIKNEETQDMKAEEQNAEEGKVAEKLEVEELPPNNTIYVNNLNEKIKLEELRESLKYIFGQYGEVVDISAKANLRMKGQAFIIYKDLDAAKKARKELNGFVLFDKPMVTASWSLL
eukprot:TRINITY_DN3337_c0_g2_i2.p1 TRINITY_DN3337_c0_g2~~TRINITY_DN3337_c0_g2_i2.p1  ORF type:complete len:133 (+),score=37.67 TRINITY_DN3337_c0_g2_i2:81-479(+)